MRLTVPSPLLATQTEPAPTAIPVGAFPTLIVLVTALVSGSMRATASSPFSVTHTPPSPTATPLGSWPTAIAVRRPVASTRVTVSA